MKKTFDFLHDLWDMKQTIRSDRHKKVMWELDRAIGKAEKQEPVAWWNPEKDTVSTDPIHRNNSDCVPLYTAPRYYPNEGHAHIEWVGLTMEDLAELWSEYDQSQWYEFIRAIETKLKEKNYGTVGKMEGYQQGFVRG